MAEASIGMMSGGWPWRPVPRRVTLAAAVVVCHVLLISGLIGAGPRQPPQIPRPSIQIELIRPEPPLPPPPSDDATTGGGAPATPSRVHVPPEPPPPEAPEPAFIAPPEPAPEPVTTIGASPVDTPDQGRGQGGQGTGTGSGVGAGSGPGSGAGRAVLLSGPSLDQIRRAQPRTGLAVRRVGRAEMRCRIRLDGRMEGCSVTREMPPGSRLGQAALSLAPHYRWRPPTDGQGRPVDNSDIIIGVDFPP